MSSVGTKRKRDVSKFYAVRIGSRPGIYHSWPDCLAQVKGFPNATFKSFTSLSEAETFLRHGLSATSTGSSAQKFYAVKSGRVPGIYTDWNTAKSQITGWIKPRHKAFPTRAEAEAFMSSSEDGTTQVDGDSKLGKTKSTVGSKRKRASIEHEHDLDIEPGEGPLPVGSIDGFDSSVVLNPNTGKVEYKNERQRKAIKMQPIGPSGFGELKIYTDGSSLGNGRNGAVAGVGVYFGPKDARNVSESLKGPRQTNQRAELTAILKAIELAPRDRDICIYSDSKYSIMCVTEWFVSWRRNGWLTSNKKQVENRDLIEQVLQRLEERRYLNVKTRFEWLKGHANEPGNTAADSLAVEGARQAKLDLARNYG